MCRTFGTLYRTRCMCCSLSDAVAAGHPLSSSWEPQAGQHGVPRQRVCFNFLSWTGKTWEDCNHLDYSHHPNIIQTSTLSTLTFIGPHGASNEWLDPYKTLKGISFWGISFWGMCLLFFGLNYFPGHLPSFGAKTFHLQTIHTILGHGTRRRKEGRKKGRKMFNLSISFYFSSQHQTQMVCTTDSWHEIYIFSARHRCHVLFWYGQFALPFWLHLLAQIIGSRRKACPGKALAHQSSPARNRCNKMDPSRWENIPAFAQLCALLSKHARRRENKGTTSPYLISRCMFIFNDVALWYIGQKFPASPKCMVPLLQSSEPRTLCVGESVGCSLCSVHCSAQASCVSKHTYPKFYGAPAEYSLFSFLAANLYKHDGHISNTMCQGLSSTVIVARLCDAISCASDTNKNMSNMFLFCVERLS